MEKEFDPQLEPILKAIGIQVKHLRRSKAKLAYKDLAETKLGMNKNTYYRIEHGEGDFTFGHLLKILNYYPDITISGFFKSAGL